jgi:hypothetical protein
LAGPAGLISRISEGRGSHTRRGGRSILTPTCTPGRLSEAAAEAKTAEEHAIPEVGGRGLEPRTSCYKVARLGLPSTVTGRHCAPPLGWEEPGPLVGRR